jgi:hypothetical protein
VSIDGAIYDTAGHKGDGENATALTDKMINPIEE